jgi:hypothetical protein
MRIQALGKYTTGFLIIATAVRGLLFQILKISPLADMGA